MSIAADWASVAVTLLLGVVGFFVARNLKKEMQLKLADRRLSAYEQLWAEMRRLSPYNPPPDSRERAILHDKLTDWYYTNGHGMLLPRVSREVYLKAKDNLINPLDKLTPKVARDRLRGLEPDEIDEQRGLLSQRQMSLLRTRLKSDLKIYGRPYGPPLIPEDRAFLQVCNVKLRSKAWSVSAAAEGPNNTEGQSKMRTAGASDDSKQNAVELAKYLWEEHKYRHDLIWRLLFRITAVAAVLAVIPFTISQTAQELAGRWIEALPGLALVLIATGWPLVVFEYKLFRPIDAHYVKWQNAALRDELRPPVKLNIFKWGILIYPGVLLILTAVLGFIVWSK